MSSNTAKIVPSHGLPTLVARYLPDDVHVFFQSENGLIGMQALPEEGFAWIGVTDAGGNPAGACAFDSVLSFGIIRGGHLDVTVLGGLEVDASGHLANWMVASFIISARQTGCSPRIVQTNCGKRRATRGCTFNSQGMAPGPR